jgi:hypothetical protein
MVQPAERVLCWGLQRAMLLLSTSLLTTSGVAVPRSRGVQSHFDATLSMCRTRTSHVLLAPESGLVLLVAGAPSSHVSAAFCCIIFAICVSCSSLHCYNQCGVQTMNRSKQQMHGDGRQRLALQ